ncbi:protein mono-ADP-ribosyltransferase PARP12-like [Saccostrea cucullata]|uniref:protein mono-ADP-ribosyltransferase PARP12-like n=1 Tax=Saccostrea cuccullata TaxID=36930 RepID=UPI002ED386C4
MNTYRGRGGYGIESMTVYHSGINENFLDKAIERSRGREFKRRGRRTGFYDSEEECIESEEELPTGDITDQFGKMDCKTSGVQRNYVSGRQDKSTRKEIEYSIENVHASYDLSEEGVFKFLVKRTGGLSSVSSFREEYFHLPVNFTEWLLKCKEKLTVYKREQEPKCIGPFYKNATLCFHHTGIGNVKECSRVNCCHFHICKFYLNGFCKNGNRCKREHDFTNEHNRKIKEKLGLEDFNDKEIRVILLCRYPQVCRARTCLAGEDCPYLHICYNFISNRCEDSECERGHSFETPHNRWVLSVYKMERWPREKLYLLRLLINMPRNQLSVTYHLQPPPMHPMLIDTETYKEVERMDCNYEIKAQLIENEQKPLGYITENREERKYLPPSRIPTTSYLFSAKDLSESRSELDADADKQYICLNALTGSCQWRGCKKHHTRLPYLWQIRMYGEWVSFDDEENQKLEQSYSSLEDSADGKLPFPENTEKITLYFRKEYGVTDMAGKSIKVPYRRLTTVSFAEEDIPLKIGTFHTQWRWYFKNDFGQWTQYETDLLQHTLEKKYISKQKSYLFTRESHKFKYKVEFTERKQINIDTKKVRKIRRRPIFVSLAEVQSRQFPRLLDVAIAEPCPAEWDPLDLAHDFEWVDLERDGREYKTVETEFFSTLRKERFQINNVFRIQNLCLWNEFEMKRANMEKTQSIKTGSIDERSLFHGTDSFDTCYGICTNNFDFRLSGKNATAYGKGSYFAVSAKYSNGFTKGPIRLMFKAKVLIGNFVKGKHDVTCPPTIPGKGHKRYDSCVDDVTNPSIFVVFDRNQCYPEYLIAYKEIPKDTSVDLPIPWSSIQVSNLSVTSVNKSVPTATSAQSSGNRGPSAAIQNTRSMHSSGVSKVSSSSQAVAGFSTSTLTSSLEKSNPTSEQTRSLGTQRNTGNSSVMNSYKPSLLSNKQAYTSSTTKANTSVPPPTSDHNSSSRGQPAAIYTTNNINTGSVSTVPSNSQAACMSSWPTLSSSARNTNTLSGQTSFSTSHSNRSFPDRNRRKDSCNIL